MSKTVKSRVDSLLDLARRYRRPLVFGAGGGGDALGAFLVWERLRRLGSDPLLGSIVWERFNVDPYPGPIPLESLAGGEPVAWTVALVDGGTIALRYGATIKPQIVRIAEALGMKTIFLDASKGAEGLREGLEAAADALGFDAIIGVDTGGDILARGCEDNLWSPLADAMSLYAIANSGLPGYVVVLAPGADGELPQEQVLEYISRQAERGALVEIFGLSRRELEAARKLESIVVSEASKIPLRAFRGEYGIARIRGGTRTVKVNPCSATAYLLEADAIYQWSPLAKLVEGTRGISQASQILNQACIVTELDLEMELSRLREHGSARPKSLSDIRSELRSRLFLRGCKPVGCD